VPTRACVVDAIEALRRMTHRGACGCEVNTGVASLLCFAWSAGLWPGRLACSLEREASHLWSGDRAVHLCLCSRAAAR